METNTFQLIKESKLTYLRIIAPHMEVQLVATECVSPPGMATLVHMGLKTFTYYGL